MRKFYFLLLMAAPVSAQPTFDWVQTPSISYSFNPDMVSYTVAADASGNSYMTGFQDQPYSYYEMMGRVFFNKYTGDGTMAFSKIFSGKVVVYDMKVDGADNVVMIVGWIASIATDNLELETASQDVQPLLLKFDASGNLMWHFVPTSSSPLAPYLACFALDTQDNIYIGYSVDLNTYIEKIAPDGTPGQQVLQEHVTRLSSVSVDDAGNIYAAGSCADPNSTFAGITVPATTGYNTYLAKYDADGTFQWLKYVEDITCPRPLVVARTPDAVYFSSHLFGAFTFDAIQSEGPTGSAFTDFFLTKLDADGNFQWMREVPGSGVAEPGLRNYLFADAQNNVYFSGRTGGTVQWSDAVQTSVTTGFSSREALLLRYNPQGDIQFAATVGGDYTRGDGVSTNAAGDVFWSGLAVGSAEFGGVPHPAGDFESYPFLAKLDQNLLGNNANNKPETLVLWPNPAHDVIHFSGQQTVKGAIYNMLGQKVHDFQVQPDAALDVSGLPTGSYMIKIPGKTCRLVRE